MTNKEKRIENAVSAIAATIMKQLMQETTYADLAKAVLEADKSHLAKENERIKAEIAELQHIIDWMLIELEMSDVNEPFYARIYNTVNKALTKHRKADQ